MIHKALVEEDQVVRKEVYRRYSSKYCVHMTLVLEHLSLLSPEDSKVIVVVGRHYQNYIEG